MTHVDALVDCQVCEAMALVAFHCGLLLTHTDDVVRLCCLSVKASRWYGWFTDHVPPFKLQCMVDELPSTQQANVPFTLAPCLKESKFMGDLLGSRVYQGNGIS
jgi:hypothetical protein